jgi:hypothetical protein
MGRKAYIRGGAARQRRNPAVIAGCEAIGDRMRPVIEQLGLLARN